MTRESRTALLESLFAQRILILDGAMGTMIQTQRAYEMNSKSIETSDQMLQRLAQL